VLVWPGGREAQRETKYGGLGLAGMVLGITYPYLTVPHRTILYLHSLMVMKSQKDLRGVKVTQEELKGKSRSPAPVTQRGYDMIYKTQCPQLLLGALCLVYHIVSSSSHRSRAP